MKSKLNIKQNKVWKGAHFKRFNPFSDKDWLIKGVKLFLFIVLFFALFGGFIANDKPLYCKIEGKIYFPVFREVLVDLNLAKWQKELFTVSWNEVEYERRIMPIIPYSAQTIDLNNMRLMRPFESREKGLRYRHWLGTDSLGRDVLAGMIRGCRIAFLVGFGSIFLASLIGLFFGLFAGYYGDKGLKWPVASLIMAPLILLSWLYFLYNSYLLSKSGIIDHSSIKLIVISLIHLLIFILFHKSIIKWIPDHKKVALPIDILLMRFIEIFKTIPALIFLLALLALISSPSAASLVGILAILLWPSIARFSRAEMLRIREENYLKAARNLGLSDLRIIINHALPNAIGPILVVIAFGISSAILLEATLSFLGLGLAFDEVSWGSMLSDARKNFKAWWLAIFPGLAIFLTIASFNIIGNRIQSQLKSK